MKECSYFFLKLINNYKKLILKSNTIIVYDGVFFLNLFFKSKDCEITVGIKEFEVKHKYNIITIGYRHYEKSFNRIIFGPRSFDLSVNNHSLFEQNFKDKYFDSKKDKINYHVRLFSKIKNIKL